MPAPEPQKSEAKFPPLVEEVDKIAVVNLVHTAGFDSEATTVIVGRNVDAALETEFGVLVQRRQGNLAEKKVKRYLLPWANIRSVEYADPPVTKS